MLLADALIESIASEWGRWFIHWFFEIVLSILALFLILLVLVQRGRGGGIAGALGGMGGNSAFGTKAGDTFTWITYGTAAVWILLAMLTIKTFTDPVQDKARRIAQQEQEEEEPSSPLDLVDPTGGDEKTTGDGGQKLRDEGAFFEKSDGEKGKTDQGKDQADGDAAADAASDEAGKAEPAQDPGDKTAPADGEKTSPAEDDKAATDDSK